MLFYNYAMSVALRYASHNMEAQEITNDAFLKVFTKIALYSDDRSFKGWLRRIVINTAIDYHRKSLKFSHQKDIEEAHSVHTSEATLSRLSEQELLTQVQALPPAYRTIFNLYAIEGYKHEEIAKQLGITIGTSKSNLAKARAKLKEMISLHAQERSYTEL